MNDITQLHLSKEEVDIILKHRLRVDGLSILTASSELKQKISAYIDNMTNEVIQTNKLPTNREDILQEALYNYWERLRIYIKAKEELAGR